MLCSLCVYLCVSVCMSVLWLSLLLLLLLLSWWSCCWCRTTGAGDLSDPEAAAAGAGQSPPVYTQWTVYKTRGAVAVKPVRPRWITIPNGGWKMERWAGLMAVIVWLNG